MKNKKIKGFAFYSEQTKAAAEMLIMPIRLYVSDIPEDIAFYKDSLIHETLSTYGDDIFNAICYAVYHEIEPITFEQELTMLINRHSKENGSNTRDYILSAYLSDCLSTFNKAKTESDKLSNLNDIP